MLEWNDKQLIRKVEAAVKIATKKGAEAVAADARRNIMRIAKSPSGQLAREIDVRTSKYKNGGHIVYAQGPGNWTDPYHAIFVEVGTPGKDKRYNHKQGPLPYLRPALKKNKNKIESSFEGTLK